MKIMLFSMVHWRKRFTWINLLVLLIQTTPGMCASSEKKSTVETPRAWYKEFRAFLLGYGFTNSRSDTSIFIFYQDRG